MALRRRFVAPVEAVAGGWRINLDDEERNLLTAVDGRARSAADGPDDNELLRRLFPVAYPTTRRRKPSTSG
jgi:hypothetical protein